MKADKNLGIKPDETVVYVRVNTLAQIGSTAAYVRSAVQDADDTHQQTAAVLATAAKHGLTLEAENVIAEYGSGTDLTGRPGMQSLLKQVESGQVKTLIVKSVDRLARDTNGLSRISDTLLKGGVRVLTADQVFHLDHAEDATRWRLAFAPTEAAERIDARGHRHTRLRRG